MLILQIVQNVHHIAIKFMKFATLLQLVSRFDISHNREQLLGASATQNFRVSIFISTVGVIPTLRSGRLGRRDTNFPQSKITFTRSVVATVVKEIFKQCGSYDFRKSK